MACFSELAYLRFNPVFKNSQQQKLVAKYLDDFTKNSTKSSLIKLIDAVAYDNSAELDRLIAELELLNAQLTETFDSGGTQAILISTDKFITLAFRGTESTSIKDVKSDLKAMKTRCDSGGNIHSGFKQAFDEVVGDIQQSLNQEKFQNKPLFITGHSLGGALATIAAKKLKYSGGIASCYTFGSPRVGDEEWISNIKVPLYRIVNAADCVTTMPPSSVSISTLSWFVSFFPKIGESIRNMLISKFGGYIHGGNMRYLTNCKTGDYDDVHLLYSVSFFYRIKMLYLNALPSSKALTDHSINLYRKKLSRVAINRNNQR
jgi:hypothetical protein